MQTPSTPRALLIAALLLGGQIAAQLPAAPTPSAAPPRPYPEHLRWWAEARFGMFIHWGPVSLKGTEISWSRANTNPKCPNRGEIPADVYDNLYRNFNPTNFDATQWAGIAKASGLKYLVLTAKHCDGFLLWPSQASDHNIAATPFRRDICAELSAAARQAGLRIGWYFSPMDWRDPEFRTDRNDAFLGRMKTELRELLSRYGTIDLLWFDWDGGEPRYDQVATYALVKSLQPRMVINNRLDLARGNSDRQLLSTNADYYTPEQAVGAYDDQRPWESCMTLSAKNQWAYGGPSDGVKPFEQCLLMLVRCAGGDGNLLLNVGPTPTGEIPPNQVERLRELGTWLGTYGESIYGTRGGPFKPGDYGVSTRKGNTIYLHVCDWPDGPLRLPAIPAQVKSCRALGGSKAAFRQTASGLEVTVSPAYRQPIDTVVALELNSSALALPAMDVPMPRSLTTKAKARASNIYRNEAEYGPEKALDADGETRWATDVGVKSAWLEVDLGQPTTFSRAAIRQAYPELRRVKKFAIEYWQDDQWKPCYEGVNLGAKLSATFPPVTAQRVRLNCTDTTDGPTIFEFQLFP